MRILLNSNWSLREEPLDCKKEMAGWVQTRIDNRYENLTLPLDVHMPLINAGIIRDPVLSDYCYESEWVEKRSWWFKNIKYSNTGICTEEQPLGSVLEQFSLWRRGT